MVIGEYAAADAEEIRRIAADCRPAAAVETWVRDDGKGCVMICGQAAAGAQTVKQVDLLFTGGEYGARGGDWLFYAGLWTPQDFRDEFLAWYRLEHLPILLECPTWNGCRFVEQKVAEGCQFHALHQVMDKATLDCDARKRSRSTPWFLRLAKQPWFDDAFTRILCRRAPP
jgi:hypothetical protein